MSRAYDPTDPDQSAEVQQSAKLRAQQREADWRWLMGAAQGRRILAELMEVAGFVQPVFSEQPLRMAFLEGRRSVGGDIYARITMHVESDRLPALLAEVIVPDGRRSRTTAERDASPRG